MKSRFDPRSAYLKDYSPGRQAMQEASIQPNQTQQVTFSKFEAYQETNYSKAFPTSKSPNRDAMVSQNGMAQLPKSVERGPTNEPEFLQDFPKPLPEQKKMKFELVKHNSFAAPNPHPSPAFADKRQSPTPAEPTRSKSPTLGNNGRPSRNGLEANPPPTKDAQYNLRAYLENKVNSNLQPPALAPAQQNPLPQPRTTATSMSQNYSIFGKDNSASAYKPAPIKRSLREQQQMDALPNDGGALRSLVLAKDSEVKLLREKLDLLKEADYNKDTAASPGDRERIEQFKLEQTERDLRAAQKENTYLGKEIDRFKNESKRQTDEFNQKIYSMKVSFDVEQRKTMENVERNIVFKHANRQNPEINFLMSRVLELEAVRK